MFTVLLFALSSPSFCHVDKCRNLLQNCWTDFHDISYGRALLRLVGIPILVKITQRQWTLYMKVYIHFCTDLQCNSLKISENKTFGTRAAEINGKYFIPNFIFLNSYIFQENGIKGRKCTETVTLCLHFTKNITQIHSSLQTETNETECLNAETWGSYLYVLLDFTLGYLPDSSSVTCSWNQIYINTCHEPRQLIT